MSVRASLVMPNGDPRDRFFYPIHTQIMDPFSCSQLFLYLIFKLNNVKSIQFLLLNKNSILFTSCVKISKQNNTLGIMQNTAYLI